MKIIIHFAFVLIFLMIVLSSCKEESVPTYSSFAIHNCHNDSIWDKQKIDQAIIGLWKHEYIACALGDRGDALGDDVTIEFLTNGALVLRAKNEIVQIATWTIVGEENDKFEINASPSIHLLNGFIRFCDNKLLFQDGQVDGCDIYFVRKR